MPATTQQVAPAQEAGRPQPQTTIQTGPGGPFLRYTQPGRRPMYAVTGNAFGALITQPLVAAPGYARHFRMRFAATGGSGTTTVTATADAPYSAVSQIIFRDAFGTPIIVGPGWEMLKAVPKYGGQFGLHAVSDPNNLPSFSAVATGASASGNFTFQTVLPLEFSQAYGVVSMANASLLPTIQLQLAASSAVYGVAPNTAVPVIEVDNDCSFYWLPEGTVVDPPGIGTTCQWILQVANPTIGSASAQLVALPRLGGYLNSLIFVFRDSTAARSDSILPASRIRMYVDGVPLLDTRIDALQDDMQIQFAGAASGQWARDAGVLAVSRKTSLNQESLGLLETGEQFLSTNPGTLIQLEGSPWGTFANTPATLNALVGQVVPAGSLIQGLPEL